mgnify:FL=1
MDNASMQHEILCRGDQTGRPYIRRLMHTANENCQFFSHVFFLYFGKFLAKIICHAINLRNFNL